MIHRFGICRNPERMLAPIYIHGGGPNVPLPPLELFPHSSHTHPFGSPPVLPSAAQKFQTSVYTVVMLTRSSKTHHRSPPSLELLAAMERCLDWCLTRDFYYFPNDST